MPVQLVGAHMPTAGGLDKALRNGKEIGCTAVQVFTSSPQQWKVKELTDELVAAFREAMADTGIDHVVSHDSYLVNLCAPLDEARERSIAGLTGELRRCSKLGIGSVVSHMGSHMHQGEEMGLEMVAESALQVLADSPDDVRLLMETTSGQGSALLYKFEHLAKVLELCKGHPRLGVCLDTCHVFAAGYDIREPEAYERTFAEFDRIVGLERLWAIHCNDSKNPFESRKDRHEHIGQGYIGEGAFRSLMRDKRLVDVPILLETPEAETMHRVNLEKLLSLAEA